MKKLSNIATAVLLATILYLPSVAYSDSTSYPGELGGLAAQAEASQQPVVILADAAKVQDFSDAMVEAIGPGAQAPEGTMFIITEDALTMPGAGEDTHAEDPWPVVAFDKDGMKTGSGMFKRGIVEHALKKALGLPI